VSKFKRLTADPRVCVKSAGNSPFPGIGRLGRWPAPTGVGGRVCSARPGAADAAVPCWPRRGPWTRCARATCRAVSPERVPSPPLPT